MKLFRICTTLVLSALVLLSSSSFMVGIHVCRGSVQDISFLSHSEGCGMEKKLPPCHNPAKPCCEDDAIVHQGDDFKAFAPESGLSAPCPVVLCLPTVLISEVIPSSASFADRQTPYDPPLPTQEITIIHRVFLI